MLHRALVAARDAWAAGERSGEALRGGMRRELAGGAARRCRVRLDRRRRDAGRARSRSTGPALLSLAVRFGSTRLIDNEPLVYATGNPIAAAVYQGRPSSPSHEVSHR